VEFIRHTDQTSSSATIATGTTAVVVQLTNARFLDKEYTAADFVFTGANAAKYVDATFTRLSDTDVLISNVILSSSTDDDVKVLAEALLEQQDSASVALIQSAPAGLSTPLAALDAGDIVRIDVADATVNPGTGSGTQVFNTATTFAITSTSEEDVVTMTYTITTGNTQSIAITGGANAADASLVRVNATTVELTVDLGTAGTSKVVEISVFEPGKLPRVYTFTSIRDIDA
jgi:hypothetical protein